MKSFLHALILLLCILSGNLVSARTIVYDGINFELSSSGNYAWVAGGHFDSDGFLDQPGNNYSGDLTIPATFEYEGVTYTVNAIHEGAFWDNNELTSVTIPATVTQIFQQAFSGCTALSNIDIKGTPKIDSFAFSACSSLVSFEFPYSVVEEGTFLNCTNLEYIRATNLSSVRDRAFYGCSKLKILEGASLTNVGDEAFFNCKSLSNIKFGELISDEYNYFMQSVTIGENAFNFCDGLIHVTLPYPTIGDYAFARCKNLKSVLIIGDASHKPNIGTKVFEQSTNLRKIAYPTYASGESYDFGNCGNCKFLSYDASGSSYSVDYFETNDCLYLRDDDLATLIFVPTDKKGAIKDYRYTIDGSDFDNNDVFTYYDANAWYPAKIIGANAFYACDDVTSIDMSNSEVKEIANSAFENILGLKSVIIGDRCNAIGDNAFRNCTSLSNVEIKSNSSSEEITIGQNAFLGDPLSEISIDRCGLEQFIMPSMNGFLTLISIGENITSIPARMFKNFTKLQEVKFPYALASIGEEAFAGCSGLKKVAGSETLKEIGTKAFADCANLEEFVLPHTVSTIGSEAFTNCKSLQTVIIPESLEIISDGVFSQCTSLNEVVFPTTLKSIGNQSFNECNALSEIVLPDSLVSIGEYAFGGCYNLKKITLGKSLESLKKSQFFDCPNIRDITVRSIIPPEINDDSFDYYIPNKATLTVPTASVKEYILTPWNIIKKMFDDNGTDLTPVSDGTLSYRLLPGVTEPENVAYVTSGEYAEMSSLMIPARFTLNNGDQRVRYNVEGVAYKAFYGCSKLESLTFHDRSTAKVIGQWAFGNCLNLKNLSLGDSIREIKGYAFANSNNTPIVSDFIDMPAAIAHIGQNVFDGRNFKTVNIKDLAKWCEVNIDTDNSNPLSHTETLLLNGNESANLNIPDGVGKINSGVFANLAFNSVTIPASVESIGDNAFRGIIGILTLKYSPVELMTGNEPFGQISEFCYDRKFNPAIIGQSTSSMTNIKIGNTIFCVDDELFANFSDVESITFGSNVESIGVSSFSGCEKLTDVIFPPSLVSIGNNAFQNAALNTILMGSNVAYVGERAFYGCPSQTVCITAPNPPEAFNSTFSNYNGTLFLLDEDAINAYYDAYECWDRFNSAVMRKPTKLETSNNTSIVAAPGESFQLYANISPVDVTLPHVFWHSTAPEIATVDHNGLVTMTSNINEMETYASDSEGCKIIARSLYPNIEDLQFTINHVTTDVPAIYSADDPKIDWSRPVKVYNLSGLEVYDNIEELQPGIYIIRQGSLTIKQIIK